MLSATQRLEARIWQAILITMALLFCGLLLNEASVAGIDGHVAPPLLAWLLYVVLPAGLAAFLPWLQSALLAWEMRRAAARRRARLDRLNHEHRLSTSGTPCLRSSSAGRPVAHRERSSLLGR